MDIITPVYVATATAVGGRNGHTETDDGMVSVDLSVPKAMGGPGRPNTATPVKMSVEDRSIEQGDLERFVREAHEKICPYSHATRGNVAVALEIIGK